jgi:hypothetical protein
MEVEGLIRTVRWLDENDVDIGTVVTDRHKQVTKYIREKLKPRGVKHFFDIWHVAKGKLDLESWTWTWKAVVYKDQG